MQYGLKEAELKKLQELFAANGSIETVILYGSRAKGNYKPFSDVDITLVGADAGGSHSVAGKQSGTQKRGFAHFAGEGPRQAGGAAVQSWGRCMGKRQLR